MPVHRLKTVMVKLSYADYERLVDPVVSRVSTRS